LFVGGIFLPHWTIHCAILNESHDGKHIAREPNARHSAAPRFHRIGRLIHVTVHNPIFAPISIRSSGVGLHALNSPHITHFASMLADALWLVRSNCDSYSKPLFADNPPLPSPSRPASGRFRHDVDKHRHNPLSIQSQGSGQQSLAHTPQLTECQCFMEINIVSRIKLYGPDEISRNRIRVT
jgi:hypothetical protein